jgi:peptidyl-prolyl cis-trans isomerase B (cyclophilin B)
MIKFVAFVTISLVLTSSSQAQKKDFVVTISTRHGNMILILYEDTPKHKANFVKLAKEHYYDSLLFHRVIAGFMIQGGDPNSKKAKPDEPLGSGGPGYTIEAEIRPNHFHKKGAVAAARLGDQQNPMKVSSGSQFYIVQGTILTADAADESRIDQSKLNSALQQFVNKPENQAYRDTLAKLYATGNREAFKKKVFSMAAKIEKETGTKIFKDVSPERINAYTTIGGTPILDNGYTVFGEVIQGLDVIDKIAVEKKDGADRPLDNVIMVVSVKELSRKKVAKLYKYHYPEIKK